MGVVEGTVVEGTVVEVVVEVVKLGRRFRKTCWILSSILYINPI